MISIRACGAFLVVMSVCALGAAFFAERALGLPPCEMCLLERVPWRIIFCLGLFSLFFGGRLGVVAHGGALIAALYGIVLSVIHVGVEFKWWESPFPACRAPVFKIGSFSQHMAALPLRPLKPCDAPTYLFHLPLSMAFIGGIAFAVVFLYLIYWTIIYLTTPRKRFRHSASFR